MRGSKAEHEELSDSDISDDNSVSEEDRYLETIYAGQSVTEFSGAEDEEDEEDKKWKEKQEKIEKKRKASGGFQVMGLSSEVYKGIVRKGYRLPTPIQRKTIPVILQGRDVVAMARTGSGKSAAFLIPLLQKLGEHSSTVGARALILSPTRDLCLQTLTFIRQIGTFTNLRACTLIGGDSLEEQYGFLAENPDIIIGTPGRVMHLLQETDLSFSRVEYVVFDEADQLFEMGFAEQLHYILDQLPDASKRQTCLFSATIPKLVAEFARAGLRDPVMIRLDIDKKISENLDITFFTVRQEDKLAGLLYIIMELIADKDSQTIVFTATRHHVEFLYQLLSLFDIECALAYGSMDPTARKLNISKFRAKKAQVLVVTDVAARGLDIPLLDNVINFDFPARGKLFLHRVGRAARAGRPGTAFNLVCPNELPYMVDIHLFLGRKLQNMTVADASPGVKEVYYGNVPQDPLDAWREDIMRKVKESIDLTNLEKTTKNAYKLYYKTRAPPSKESIARTKTLDMTCIHPTLLARVSEAEMERHGFLNQIRQFRPRGGETVFELQKNLKAEDMMKAKRKEHNSSSIVLDNPDSAENTESVDVPPQADVSTSVVRTKRKPAAAAPPESAGIVKKRKMKTRVKKTSFRDESFFMNTTRPEAASEHHTERGLAIKENPDRLEDAVLDLMGEDERSLLKNRAVYHWDQKKKKYVKEMVTYGSTSEKKGHSYKKVADEGIVKTDTKKKAQSYANWKAKSHLRIQKAGETEESGRSFSSKDRFRAPKGRHEKHNEKMRSSSRDSGGGKGKSIGTITKERQRKELLKQRNKSRSQKRVERSQKNVRPNAGKKRGRK